MPRPIWVPAYSVPTARVIPFPTVETPATASAPAELGGALTFASPENLILQTTHLLERIVRLAGSLSEDQIITVLADLLTIEAQRLEPFQFQIERHRSFLSDLSAKQARRRRRRQRRVKEQLSA